MSGSAPDKIRPDSIIHKDIRSLLHEIQRYKFEVTILDMTTDIKVPTVCCALIDRLGGRAVTVSLESGFDIEHALLKTLRDAVRHGASNNRRLDTHPICNERRYAENILSMQDRRLLWAHQCMVPRIQFLLSGKEKDFKDMTRNVPIVNRGDELSFLKKVLNRKGYAWYAVDVTASVARREKVWVVKVILPDLIPLFFSEQDRPLGVSRMYTAPVTTGLRAVALTEDELNPVPHPFL